MDQPHENSDKPHENSDNFYEKGFSWKLWVHAPARFSTRSHPTSQSPLRERFCSRQKSFSSLSQINIDQIKANAKKTFTPPPFSTVQDGSTRSKEGFLAVPTSTSILNTTCNTLATLEKRLCYPNFKPPFAIH